MKPVNIKSNTLVKVTWQDSAFEQGWVYRSVPLSLPKIATVGYVTHCTKEFIEVAGSIGLDGKRGSLNPLALPFGMILSIEIIRGGK